MDVDPRVLASDHDRLRRRAVRGVGLDGLVFALMHGNGNVILVVDTDRSGLERSDVDSVLAKEICQTFTAIRVDGIAFLSFVDAGVKMTYFEGDGLHSVMCGNALRCLTRYCVDRGYLPADQDFVATDDGPKWVSAAGGEVRVALGEGREFQQVDADRWFVFSALPHLVVEVPDLAAVDVKREGATLRFDEKLAAHLGHQGLHVDFVQRHADHIAIRTYEPGTEDETLACGTGVGGAAYVANTVWQLPFPIRVQTRGGEMTVDHHDHGLLISGTIAYLLTADTPQRAG
ncbi:diaminopimelate epimerase [Actinokineospora auranticolor]|uniref:Diaminopimelate epimerase n=1 Tax=Actinokineospora auranticolor TaxID=155976 RepID=A0A2S6H138_9PSEU|nr:diaminopimelate epimerase [Actinokineospora auranticolor]PPK71174.1 diaminopimelate epimerase [Actinokineospora auranticolor]